MKIMVIVPKSLIEKIKEHNIKNREYPINVSRICRKALEDDLKKRIKK